MTNDIGVSVFIVNTESTVNIRIDYRQEK